MSGRQKKDTRNAAIQVVIAVVCGFIGLRTLDPMMLGLSMTGLLVSGFYAGLAVAGRMLGVNR